MSPFLLWPLAACDPGDVKLAPNAGRDTGTLSVSIHAVIDTPYAPVGLALGWTGGVPGAEVRAHLMVEPYDSTYWHLATTDSSGTVRFSDLLYGLYEVEVTRSLSPSETGRAGGALQVFAGGRRLYLPSPRTEDITMAPARSGSLIFSEFSLTEPPDANREYPDAKYFEVFNNADTTIYLDGMYWGIAWDLNRDYPAWPCAQTVQVRNDSAGIWVQKVFQFPGSGMEFPLRAGQSAVIAKSAIDHRVVDPRLPDLSHADFEWGGSRNADNPDVPNLRDVGLRPMVLSMPGPEQPEFLSEPVDLSTLPRYTDPSSGYTWVRIPKSLVLDVWVGAEDWTTTSYTPSASCLESAHRYFERLPGPAFAATDFELDVSEQRRVLLVLPDSRKVLQDTETSMADFVKQTSTPGWIP